MRLVALGTTLLVTLGFLAGRADAKDKDLQRQEVQGDVDLGIVSLGNEAIFNLKYTFTPEGIDRNDEIPPILRRFLRHPFALFAEISHDGGTRDAITNLQLGAEVYPLDGHLYARVEGGVGRHLTIFDEPSEFGYFFGTLYGEAGFRPVNGIQLGAYYRGNFIIEEDLDNSASKQARRSGTEQTFGALVTVATPNDRIYLTASAFANVDDWTFENCGPICLYPGNETVRGFGGSLRVAYQITMNMSIQLNGTVTRDHWVDGRTDETDHMGIPPANLILDRNVWGGVGTADLLFWYMGRYGFRLTAGGGYQQAPPLYLARNSGLLKLGGSVLLRF